MIVSVSTASVSGTIAAPPSKSAMQRAVACALLSEGRSEIINPSLADDSLSALSMAECLGADIKKLSDRFIIQGGFNPLCNKVFCGESGLGARLFSVIAALSNDWIEITGEGSLTGRPFNMLNKTLTQLGVEVITTNGSLPLKVKGPMKAGRVIVDGSLSSQFLTGLLIALPILENNSRLFVRNLKSKPYIDLTIEILNHFGIKIDNEEYTIFNIPGSQSFKPGVFTVEGDWSGAAFLLVMGAIAGELRIRNISYLSTQPDTAIIEIIKETGAIVEIAENDITVRNNELRSFEIDISDCPDLAPPLAVLASFCKGKSVIYGTERLKIKESNRGEALEKEFTKLGVKITNYNDRIEIVGPSKIRGGNVDSHGDHRIAMALTILSLASDSGVVITGAESVNKSYPSFYDDLIQLGIKIKKT